MNTNKLHDFLKNPKMTGENLIKAHSDHFYYTKESDISMFDSFNMPLRQSLNGIWKFKYSKNLFERPEDFYKKDYPLDDFDDIKVPAHIEMEGYDTKHYTNVQYPWDGTEHLLPPDISKEYAPVGSYVTEFSVNSELMGGPLFISFQGVEVGFRVWVNGQYVGYSEDSFTPAEFEITGLVIEGKNRLAVECYKRTSAIWLEDQDMWRFFGIFRDVYLFSIPKAHVWDMFARATLTDDYANGKLRLDLKISGKPEKGLIRIEGEDGFTLLKYFDIEGESVSLAINEIEDIKPWSAEEPNLYTLIVELIKDGAVSEYAVTKIGFRTFEIKDKVMLINGKRILFKGVDRHEFSAMTGRACSYEDMLWDIKTFKRNNINAVRTSHYPNSSRWYRLCDEYGIYMIDETNLETHGTWCSREFHENNLVVPGSNPDWTKAVVERAEHMFERDKNHPAVVMWSLGNEAFGGKNFEYMSNFFHEHDDTRIVHYEGVVNNRPFDYVSDVESRMYAKPADIRAYLSDNPKKPYMSCEYMHAMGNSLGGMKIYTDLEDEFTMYQGGFIWDYLDQALWQEHNGKMRLAYGGDFGDRPTEYIFSTDGIVFADRTESPKCNEAKNLYANVHLSVDEKGFTVQNRNLFISLSRYYFEYAITENGKTVYTKMLTDIDTKPGATTKVKVPHGYELNKASDYVFLIRMCEKNTTKWADAGFEVAFSEKVKWAKVNPMATPKCKLNKFKFASDGLGNVGGLGDNFRVLFSKTENGLGSFNLNGREMVTRGPKPTYFRAYTDNDRGFRLGEKANFWHMLSLYQHGDIVEYKDNGDNLVAAFTYKQPGTDDVFSKVTYTVYSDGHMRIDAEYIGHENVPMLPLFGWEMKVDASYNNVEYFGKGPVENYRDRNNGVYTGVFTTKVSENVTPYLVPQEVGNRTGVRYLKITDDAGHGYLFSALSETFEAGFLPYSAYEMENALHLDELPNRNYSWIRIMAAQMGVGGDDSWGAPVQEQFRLDSAKNVKVSFELRMI